MNHLLDDEDDLASRAEHRELTLSTSAVLAIFFGLAILCALFLGLGYNLGRKSAQPSLIAAADAQPTASTTTNFNSFKPAAGLPANTAPPLAATASPSSTAPIPARPLPSPAAAGETSSTRPAAVQPSPTSQVPAASAMGPSAAPAAAGSFIVQVAAVSHQEDADLLVGALKAKGYAVAPRSEPQDKLVHIQVGPFTNRKDAEAMRQRLLSDGYNAIVK